MAVFVVVVVVMVVVVAAEAVVVAAAAVVVVVVMVVVVVNYRCISEAPRSDDVCGSGGIALLSALFGDELSHREDTIFRNVSKYSLVDAA